MASLIVKTLLGEAATPKNVAILFAMITVLIVSVVMYFGSKDCGTCAFTMLKYFFVWGIAAAITGYIIGKGIQFDPASAVLNSITPSSSQVNGEYNMQVSDPPQDQQSPQFTLVNNGQPTANPASQTYYYNGQLINAQQPFYNAAAASQQ